ncbi:MAG: EVE domain-containing protein [Phycicoccus sp.]
MTRAWVDVVGLEHTRAGVEGGFVQADHGRSTRLSRLDRGDVVVIYSPRTRIRAGEVVQQFTALGIVADDECRQVRMAPSFRPWRRRVRWLDVEPAPVRPLLGRLTFLGGTDRWGTVFRRGLFEIPVADAAMVAEAMGVGRRSLAEAAGCHP